MFDELVVALAKERGGRMLTSFEMVLLWHYRDVRDRFSREMEHLLMVGTPQRRPPKGILNG